MTKVLLVTLCSCQSVSILCCLQNIGRILNNNPASHRVSASNRNYIKYKMLLYPGIEEGWNGPTDLFWRTFLLTIIDFPVHLTFIILTKHPTFLVYWETGLCLVNIMGVPGHSRSLTVLISSGQVYHQFNTALKQIVRLIHSTYNTVQQQQRHLIKYH